MNVTYLLLLLSEQFKLRGISISENKRIYYTMERVPL